VVEPDGLLASAGEGSVGESGSEGLETPPAPPHAAATSAKDSPEISKNLMVETSLEGTNVVARDEAVREVRK
jgi:hypothetical protein